MADYKNKGIIREGDAVTERRIDVMMALMGVQLQKVGV
jgi:hypothetical protein